MTSTSDRLIGTLVHRLLQHVGFGDLAFDEIRDLTSRLVHPDEIDENDDLDAIVDAAATAYAGIGMRADIRELYATRRMLHEVPFTLKIDGRVLRGTVDCLVETAPGRLMVLEFKTGRPRPEHQAQVNLYLQAMKGTFPDAAIDSRVVYPEKMLNSSSSARIDAVLRCARTIPLPTIRIRRND